MTPVLENVGAGEIWEGAPARSIGAYTHLQRTAIRCQPVKPAWFSESLNLLMQIFLEMGLLVVPTAAVAWFAAGFIPAGASGQAAEYFNVTPLPEIVWHLGLYAVITSWTTIVVVSLLACLFIRWTPTRPGIHPTRQFQSALVQYRVKKLNQVQRLWTWSISGQYLRALAGLRFTRIGASECDVMVNLVPELTSADARVFWSHGCYANQLDQGADFLRLGQLDMPVNFFASNNSVAEAGQFPTNFLLGVSTPGSDIRFRRQMRTRPGEPRTVAGNPPLEFASPDFSSKNGEPHLPGFSLFLVRFLLFDIFSIGLLPIAEVFAYASLYTVLSRLGGHPAASALVALVLVEAILVGLCILVKKLLVGKKWGIDDSAPFWSIRHFTYFFTQDCYFRWCGRPLKILAGTVLSNPLLRRMGSHIGKRTIVTSPLQVFDWNATRFDDDCVIDGMLQFHTLEEMKLKVKRSHVQRGCSVNFGATLMGGAVLEAGTTLLPLSLVLKDMHLPPGTCEGSPAQPAESRQNVQ
ncbi:MAG: hypothetical protein JRG96_13440 [Deltaproteobacteria bacterium]|nr:hypothetical protein [Deltaproteobacteria bacterium]